MPSFSRHDLILVRYLFSDLSSIKYVQQWSSAQRMSATI
jgi:hypothetical protein